MIKGYEMVIGLEVHIELKTATKIFCGCLTAFGAEPNTQCCPVCMGYPGTLPVLNQRVAEYAITAGLALNCDIAPYSKQDRKNYFYPDLPKAYQISQYDLPLCKGGWLDIETAAGPKRVGITRIHIEEDAGKLLHSERGTLVDCNRCGVPLIEVVSEPDLRSAEEARAYLRKLRAVILYTGVSDCKMNEGSMRCDVNLSVRKQGETKLGARAEMKNLNSIQFAVKSIEYEYARQVEVLEAGGQLTQETRRFDPDTGRTYPMRVKEDANDYRYFPDPDLPPVTTTAEQAARIKALLPELPDARKARYAQEFKLQDRDGEIITSDKGLADYFEQSAALCKYPKILANLLISDLGTITGGSEDFACPVTPRHMAELAELLGDEIINNSTAKRILKDICEEDRGPREIVASQGLEQINDEAALLTFALSAIEADPKSARDFRNGKDAAAKVIIGRAMARSGGKANPRKLSQLVSETLRGS
ncbi:MAG: Asp-tRNA(Asn)/Glu-tRNA(Gln) amidotransferase subunit GatB [Clostridiales bacterium]|jgi:aspartyl-tRNA(Asn)/glutamyl-tRNA(Gln) amidotransferase subunit B|nr:Asp-tRNA(Asn)/Glu-tRNA(Gln) amidotransferase subunit GatB [Clostridiales bacterium]